MTKIKPSPPSDSIPSQNYRAKWATRPPEAKSTESGEWFPGAAFPALKESEEQRQGQPHRAQAGHSMAHARHIDVILVSELTRWGRSMLDLVCTLQNLRPWDVALVPQSGKTHQRTFVSR